MPGKKFGAIKGGKPTNGDDGDNVIDNGAETGPTKINGGDGNDDILGSSGADRVNAGDGDDTVEGGLGNDILFGNDGTDTAVFSGSILDYEWMWTNGNTLNVSGQDGEDQLKHFEILQFDDFAYSTDGDNAPVAVLRSGTTTEENTSFALSIDLYDFDGDSVSVISVSSSLGTVSANEGLPPSETSTMGSSEGLSITFDPGTDFDYLAVGEVAIETIELVIEDTNGNQTTIAYDITVTGSNDAPVISVDAGDSAAASLLETDAGLSASGTLTLEDVDVSDEVGITVTGVSASTTSAAAPPTEATLLAMMTVPSGAILDGTETSEQFTWVFDSGSEAFDDLAAGETLTLTYTLEAADDNSPAGTDTQEVTIIVTGTNDAPVAQAVNVSGNEDQAILGTAVATDIDSGATLSYALESGPSHGTVTVNSDGTFNYIGDEDFNGTDSFDFIVTDENGATDTETVTVTVAPVNDDPEANDGSGSVTEDGTLVASGNLGATDVDGDSLTYSVVGGGTGTYGTLSVDAGGTWTYTLDNDAPVVQDLDAGDAPVEVFQIEVSDGNGGSTTSTVSVTVNGADDQSETFGLAQEHLPEGSVVGITTWGNSSSPSLGNEPYNIQQAAESFGYSTQFTAATTEADMAAFLSGADALIISEMEFGSYPSDVTGAVEDFVESGGTLVIVGSSSAYDVNFLNETFGWSLTEGTWSTSDTYDLNPSEAGGTVFEDNTGSMPWNNAVYQTLDSSSLPDGSLEIYDRNGNDASTSVAVMPYGEGQVTWLSYDYFNAAPNGSQDSGWTEALQDALSTGSAAPDYYVGVLEDGVTQSGQVPSSGGFNSPSPDDSDYWLFYAEAGDVITVDVDRTEGALDPALWLFEGVVDPADLGTSIDGSDPGYLAFADDDDPAAVPGPWADPSATIVITESGYYTAIVTDFASGSDGGDGSYGYDILLT